MVKEEKAEEAGNVEAVSEKREKKEKPSWVKMKSGDVEKLVVELAKKGNSPAKIGLILRDEHGIPKKKLFGKRISQILKENGIDFPGERSCLDNKIKMSQTHFERHKHDYQASRALSKRLWALNRLQGK